MKEATNSYKSLSTILMYLGIFKEEYWHLDYKINNFKYNGKNYFWDISKKATWFKGKFDEKGIYLYKGADGENYYSVINLAQYALGSYEEYLRTKELKWKKEFLKHCDWLVENQEVYKTCSGIWMNKYPMKSFNLNGDWSSSLAQAFGISALTRAYLETENQKYLNGAIEASKSFFIKVEDGGVFYEKDNFICFEEYTTKSNSSVLNGHIFSMWAIYDLLQLTSSLELKKLYDDSVQSLKENLNKWDLGYWSRYDLWDEHFNIASYFYHDLHVKQLKILYILTEEKSFKQYYKKWEKNKNNKFVSLYSLIKKILFRLKKR